MRYKKGNIPHNISSIGTITIRKDGRNKYRRSIKIDINKWIFYARYLYELHYGNIPKNYIIHHKDGNTLNDTLSNLVSIEKYKHIKYHNPNIYIPKNYADLEEQYYREQGGE